MEKARGVEHLDLRPWLQRLAANYEHQRRYGEAERLYQRAIAITEEGSASTPSISDPWLRLPAGARLSYAAALCGG